MLEKNCSKFINYRSKAHATTKNNSLNTKIQKRPKSLGYKGNRVTSRPNGRETESLQEKLLTKHSQQTVEKGQ